MFFNSNLSQSITTFADKGGTELNGYVLGMILSGIGLVGILFVSFNCNGFPIPLNSFNGINFHNCLGRNVILSTLSTLVLIISPIGLIISSIFYIKQYNSSKVIEN